MNRTQSRVAQKSMTGFLANYLLSLLPVTAHSPLVVICFHLFCELLTCSLNCHCTILCATLINIVYYVIGTYNNHHIRSDLLYSIGCTSKMLREVFKNAIKLHRLYQYYPHIRILEDVHPAFQKLTPSCLAYQKFVSS